ncbi:hypothetical protein Q9966_016085 [Columba livia]|nr:hypothetical protein Q9966_016085 [Columba livia]
MQWGREICRHLPPFPPWALAAIASSSALQARTAHRLQRGCWRRPWSLGLLLGGSRSLGQAVLACSGDKVVTAGGEQVPWSLQGCSGLLRVCVSPEAAIPALQALCCPVAFNQAATGSRCEPCARVTCTESTRMP